MGVSYFKNLPTFTFDSISWSNKAFGTRARKQNILMAYSDTTYVGLGPGLIQCQSLGPI